MQQKIDMNNSLITTEPKKKENRIAEFGILFVFLLALLEPIQNIKREAFLPFAPEALTVTLLGIAFMLLLSSRINIKLFKKNHFIALNAFNILILLSSLYSIYPLLTASRSLQFLIVSNCLYLILVHVKDLEKTFHSVALITIAFIFLSSVYGSQFYIFRSLYSFYGFCIFVITFFVMFFCLILSVEFIYL